MATFEVRADGQVVFAGDEAGAVLEYEKHIENPDNIVSDVMLCKITILESVERGLVVKKRRGRKPKLTTNATK